MKNYISKNIYCTEDVHNMINIKKKRVTYSAIKNKTNENISIKKACGER